MARTPTPLHYYDLGSGRFDETSTYPFTGAAPTRLYFGTGGTLTPSAPPAGVGTGSSPIPGLTLPTLPAAQSDTLIWSPSGVPCGRPIDQWAMGGLSAPAGSVGFLAPCTSDDPPSQVGPWATSYTTAPFSHAETLAGPITATVYASATTSETQLVAELEEVTPDGTSYPLTEGALLGSLRAVDTSRSWTAGSAGCYGGKRPNRVVIRGSWDVDRCYGGKRPAVLRGGVVWDVRRRRTRQEKRSRKPPSPSTIVT